MMKKISPETKKLLEKAAEIIETRGWGQHGNYWEFAELAAPNQEPKNFCMVGACMEASKILQSSRRAQAEAEEALYKALAPLGVVEFNDHKAKSKEEVLEVFRRVVGKRQPRIKTQASA